MSTAIFETDTDKWRALAFALLLHVLVVAALFFGLLWQREPPPMSAAAGEIEATLITSPRAAAAASKAVQAAEQAQQDSSPPPQPIPERAPQTAHIAPQLKPQQAQDQPDTVDQQRVSALALQAAEQQKQAQEEKHRQEQILLQQQAQNEAENKQRLAAQQLQRQAQLDAIHVEQAKVARQIKLVEQKRKQLEDQKAQLADPATPARVGPATPPAGNRGIDQDLKAKYVRAINEAVNRNWHSGNVQRKVICKVKFIQERPTGEVLDVLFTNCPYDAAGRESVEALKGIRLPYAGYESVFQSEINVDMCHPQEDCLK